MASIKLLSPKSCNYWTQPTYGEICLVALLPPQPYFHCRGESPKGDCHQLLLLWNITKHPTTNSHMHINISPSRPPLCQDECSFHLHPTDIILRQLPWNDIKGPLLYSQNRLIQIPPVLLSVEGNGWGTWPIWNIASCVGTAFLIRLYWSSLPCLVNAEPYLLGEWN